LQIFCEHYNDLGGVIPTLCLLIVTTLIVLIVMFVVSDNAEQLELACETR